jgi:hypothetical protein
MRVGAVGIHRRNRRTGSDQPMVSDAGQNELLKAIFIQRHWAMHALFDMLKRFVDDPAQFLGGIPMRRELKISPDRFESLDEVGRRDDLDAEATDQLDRPCIDTRNIGNRIHGRILHGHAACTA